MKYHLKKRFPGLELKRINDIEFFDVIIPSKPKGTSIRGYNYMVLIVFQNKKTLLFYDLKKKSDAHKPLQNYFLKVGVPLKVVTDGGKEMNGK